ncbi:MAG: shikimate dehydrogenase [Solobacterium sp.]|nr:shikimate dehydrogenase [Solobacterium sp.]
MKLGLIGYPLGHSWSKPIHDFMIGSDYQMFELKPEELEGFMTKKDFDGLNVTIPYKQKVMKYLDEIDETAAKIGAVNTIVNHNGVLKGYNTDYLGFMEMLKRNHIDVQGKKTAVLGSGGASRAVAAALAILGADFDIVSRKAERENTILYETMYERSDDYQVIVNTTPLGLAPHPDDMPVNLSRFTKLEAVADIIANPLRTRLLFEAGCRGLKTAGGLEMLVAQAWHADLLYTGEQLDPQLITDCLAELYRDRRSIVLIGMPTAGKTTVSALLGEACGRDVIEMDDEIVEILGTSIK